MKYTKQSYYVFTVTHADGSKTTKLVDYYNFYYWFFLLQKQYGSSNVSNIQLKNGQAINMTYDIAIKLYDNMEV